MTLSIAWRDPRFRVHFLSDSRVNLGSSSSDFGIKVSRMPYNIYEAGQGDEPPELLRAGDLGIMFSGYSIIPLMMKEALAEILASVQAVPGFIDYDMRALARLVFHGFSVIAQDADEKTNNRINAGVIFGGWCEQERKHLIFQMAVTKDDATSMKEVLTSPGEIVTMGSGKVEADVLLAKSRLDAKDVFGALQAVIDNPKVPSVGGNIQYGDFDANRFRPHGVFQIKDGLAHHWRGLLDLNSLQFQNSTGLVPNFPLIDIDRI